ncbi:MAG TPA: hypothetical protein VFR97_10270 [Capillimicrobium sp.]|nr:hypothetical protein [Capillimicrobium sp.]
MRPADVADAYRRALREAAEEVGRELLKEAQALTPVMDPADQHPGTGYPGQLRDSAELEVIDAPGGFRIALRFRTEYAVKQHENLRLKHPNGKGKFLSDPVKAMIPRYRAELARRVREKMAALDG